MKRILIAQVLSLLCGICKIELMLDIFLSRDEGRLRELLVETGDLNLFPVFRHFLKIVGGSEFLKLFLEFLFHLYRDLVGTFADNADSLIDVACLFGHGDHVAGHSVERSVSLFIIHDGEYMIKGFVLVLHVFTGDFVDVVGLFPVFGVGEVVGEGEIFIHNVAVAVGLALVDGKTGFLIF